MDSQSTQETAIKNLVIDLGGIIAPLHTERCVAAFRSIKAPKTAEYVAEHRTEDFFLDLELGKINAHEFCDCVRQLDGTDAPDEKIIRAWNALILNIPTAPFLTLRHLKEKCRMFLLSNTNEIHWKHVWKLQHTYFNDELERLFDRFFLSYEMGMMKPSEEIFNAVLREAGIKAEETLFIDDSHKNCKAAEKLGFHTLCDPSGERWDTTIKNKLYKE